MTFKIGFNRSKFVLGKKYCQNGSRTRKPLFKCVVFEKVSSLTPGTKDKRPQTSHLGKVVRVLGRCLDLDLWFIFV